MIASRWREARTVLLAVAVLATACTGAGGDVPGPDAAGPGLASMEAVSYRDVASEVGLEFRHGAFRWGTTGDPPAMMGGGLCWIDYNRDGWLDLFLVNTWSDGEYRRWTGAGGPPRAALFRNEEGRFVDVAAQVGAAVAVRGNGCVAADLDGNGWTDLYVTTDRANVLLWNDEGVFVDGSEGSGADAYGWHTAAAAGDVDRDGRIDLYVTGYGDRNRPIPGATKGFPNTIEPEADLLLLNEPGDDGRPRFRDVAADAGVEAAQLDYGLGAVLSDVDGDGDLDVFVANDTQPNRLYLNQPHAGPLGFALIERGAAASVDDDNAGMGVAAADVDGDGRPELAVTNMGEQLHNVFRSSAAGPDPAYVDALAEMGLPELGVGLTGWGTAWVDADLDGDLDLVIAHGAIPVADLDADREPVLLYENGASAPGLFEDASATVGLDDAGPYLARGLAAADYDNDGDVDLAVATVGGRVGLLRNSGARGHWLAVAPDPPLPGTVVTIRPADGPAVRRELLAGSSYLSSEDPRLHFGVPSAAPVGVDVRWPDGSTAALDDVAVGQILVVAAR